MTLAVDIRKALSGSFTLDVSFTIGPGIAILFGESGSGKTTLLQCLAGLLRPDKGTITLGDHLLFDGSRRVDIAPADRSLGYVFQQLALFPHLTVAANLEYGLSQLDPAERRIRVHQIADSFQIRHLLARRPGDTSGGERQRVALARSLVTDPSLLLLDEPLAALDHATQSRIIEDLRQWNDARRVPILYVTHAHREAFALGERVLVLHDGRLVADGLPHDVIDAPSVEPLARLAGFENILTTTVMAAHREAGIMTCRPVSSPVNSPVSGPVSGPVNSEVELEVPWVDQPIGSELRVAVRAGDILVATEQPRGLSARNVLPGTILSLTREGHIVRLRIDAGVIFEAHVTPNACEALRLQNNQRIWIVIKTHSCRIVSTL